MKRPIFCILFALIPLISFAQGLIEPGYYIDIKGEKHQGYFVINDVQQSYPPYFLFIKKRASAPDTLYNSQLAEVKVLDFHYERRQVKIYDAQATTNISEPKFKQTTIFLKTELQGHASLFSYMLDEKFTYFLGVGDEKPIQLIYQEFLKQGNRTSTNVRFQFQMKEQLTCSKSIKFDELKYRRKDLIRALSADNKCMASDYHVYSGLSGLSFKYLNIGVIGGVSALNLESTQVLLKTQMAHFSPVQLPQFGLELEYLIPPFSNRFSLFINGQYQHFSDEKEVNAEGSDQMATLNYQTIQASAGVRAHFRVKEYARVFLDLGYGKDFEVGDGISIHYTISNPFKTPQLPGHLTGGVGLALLNRYIIEARFKHLNNTLSGPEAHQRVVQSLFSLNVKYLLKSYYK
jgi:hypothetical protein